MEIASLHGERVDILCDVGGLQVDLDRVRQDCTSLGLDLAAVRRERDERGARRADGAELVKLQEELRTVRKRLAVFEQKVAEHVCPSCAVFLLLSRVVADVDGAGMRTRWAR